MSRRLPAPGPTPLRPPCPALPQVAALTALARLAIRRSGCTPAGFRPLARLAPCLQHLELSGCAGLPAAATFSALTALRNLRLHDCGGSVPDAAALQAALEQVPQLTGLAVGHAHTLPAFPAALEGLHQLQQLEWEGAAPKDALLPAGPWLRRLTRVALPADAAAASLAVLSAAWRLEALSLGSFTHLPRNSGSSGGSGSGDKASTSPCTSPRSGGTTSHAAAGSTTCRPAAQLEVVRWAARQPHLLALYLQVSSAALAADLGLAAAVEEAARLRPALRIVRRNV